MENLRKISLISIEKASVTQPNIYSLGVYSLSKAMDHQNLIETDVAIDRQTTGVWQSKLNLGIGAPDDTLA